MPDPALWRALADRIAAICATGQTADAAIVAEIAAAAASAVSAEMSVGQEALLREVESLGRTIADARAEIAALGVTEIRGRHIPAAADELDAIVSHTAAATDTILAACESLDTLAATLDEAATAGLQAVATTIYEACAFQDITGQRITRVIAALKAIDAKVVKIVAEQQRQGAPAVRLDPVASSGPQLPAAAMRQADVDHLLGSLG